MAINNARIDLSHLTRIADDPRIKPAHLSTLPDQSFQGFLDMQETLLQQKYTTTAETDDHPAYQPYAKVVVGGKVVAEIDNHGWTASSNAFGAQIQQGLPQTGAGGEIDGPELARARAEYIAAQTGGRVEMADTALTQQEFSAVPSLETRLDKTAMMRDPDYQKLTELRRMRTEFLAQKMGQEMDEAMMTNEARGGMEPQSTEKTAGELAREEFLKYMEMTPEERYWEAFLKSRDMTQEQFDALPPDEKLALTEQFENEMKEKLAGSAIDKAEEEIVA